jgi:hypothetical protein
VPHPDAEAFCNGWDVHELRELLLYRTIDLHASPSFGLEQAVCRK